MFPATESNNVGACTKRKLAFTFVDICIVGLAALPLLIFKVSVTPYMRGFYCEDDSIKYPFKNSTITSTALYTIGFVVNLILICLFEFIHYLYGSSFGSSNANPSSESTTSYTESSQVSYPDSTRRKIYQYFYNVYRVFLPFVFGAVVEHLTTDIGKYSIGRLRPHFLSVCKPDTAQYDCTSGYITADVCTGDQSLIREARLSFPSGHASFSSYSMIFAILYVQARLQWRSVLLLRPLVQLVLFYMAFYTCLSRVSDYKHHWSDVLAGAIIGFLTAVLVVFKVSDLFETKPKKAKPAAPVIQNMSVQNPEHAIMGLRHFTETPASPQGRSDPHPHYHSQSKGYHNSHFTEDDYDDGYYTGGSRQRNGGPQKYPGNDINTERPISTQVYYIDASENAERERKPTFSKMTTQL